MFGLAHYWFEKPPAAWVPRSKHDLQRAQAAAAAGYPAVEPVIPELLEWLADCNWPVARQLAPFLASIGEPLAPHIRRALAGDDDIWKYWLLDLLVQPSASLRRNLHPELLRLAEAPTPGEVTEEVDQLARQLLQQQNRAPGWNET